MNELEFKNKYLEAFAGLKQLKIEEENLKLAKKELEETLFIAMQNHNIKSINNELVTISFVDESESVSLDTKSLLAQEPDLYHELEEKYNKRTKRKSHIRIKVK